MSGGGIVRADESGNVAPFAVSGTNIAGLDFSRENEEDDDEFEDYGTYLYAGVWEVGDIYRIDTEGNAEPFASNPGTETRYLKIGKGGDFGHYLYYTDFIGGDIFSGSPQVNCRPQAGETHHLFVGMRG